MLKPISFPFRSSPQLLRSALCAPLLRRTPISSIPIRRRTSTSVALSARPTTGATNTRNLAEQPGPAPQLLDTDLLRTTSDTPEDHGRSHTRKEEPSSAVRADRQPVSAEHHPGHVQPGGRQLFNTPHSREMGIHPTQMQWSLIAEFCEAGAVKTSRQPADLMAELREQGAPIEYLLTGCCARYARQEKWDAIISVVRNANNCGVRSLKLVNWHARASLETNNFQYVHATLDELATLGIEPDELTLVLLLRGALKSNNVFKARHVLAEIDRRGYMNPSILLIILRSSSSLAVIEDLDTERQVLDLLPHLPPNMQTAMLNALIPKYLERDDVATVLQLLSLFERERVETITEVLSGSGGQQKHDDTSYPKPLDSPPTPNALTFLMFIHYCGVRHGDFAGALRLLQSFMASGKTPTEKVIAALAHTCFECDRPELAVQLIAGVCDPATNSTEVFEDLLPGSMAGPRFEIHVPSMVPSIYLFNTLMKGMLKLRGMAGAERVLAIMKSNNVAPNEYTLDVLLKHLTFEELLQPSQLLSVLKTFTIPGLAVTQQQVVRVMRVMQKQLEFVIHGDGWTNLKYPKSRKPPHAHKASMTSVDEYDSTAGVKADLFREYGHLTRRFMNDLGHRRIEPNASAFALRMAHEATITMHMGHANLVLRDMIARGVKPDARHFGILMHGFALQGRPEAVVKVMRRAERHGTPRNVIMFTTLITAWARRGNPRNALGAFCQMVEYGIRPDVGAVDAVAAAYHAKEMPNLAKEFLIENWHYSGHPFPEELRDLHVQKLSERWRTLYRKSKPKRLQLSKKQRTLEGLTGVLERWKGTTPKDEWELLDGVSKPAVKDDSVYDDDWRRP